MSRFLLTNRSRIDRVAIAAALLAAGSGAALAADSPPTTPAGPVANVYSATSGAVRWQRSSDDRLVVGYEVSRDGRRLGTVDALSYVERGLEPGRTYRYTIVAVDTAGQRSGTARVSLVTPDATPSAPGGLRADVYSRTTVELFWDRSGVFGERYVIKRDGQEVGTTDGTTYIDRTLTTARPYLFEVIALNRQGDRSAPTRLFVSTAPDGGSTTPTPPEPALAAPSGLRSSVYSKTAAELFWVRPDTFGLRYEVRRDGTLLTTTDGVGYYDNGLEAGRSYTYEITATARDGRRSSVSTLMLSTPGDATPPAPVPTLAAPANLRSDVYSRTSAELFWDRASTPGLRYEVTRDGALLGTTDGTGYYDNTLSSGTRYTYEIVALDGTRRSNASAVSLTTQGDRIEPTSPPLATINVENRDEILRNVLAVIDGSVFKPTYTRIENDLLSPGGRTVISTGPTDDGGRTATFECEGGGLYTGSGAGEGQFQRNDVQADECRIDGTTFDGTLREFSDFSDGAGTDRRVDLSITGPSGDVVAISSRSSRSFPLLSSSVGFSVSRFESTGPDGPVLVEEASSVTFESRLIGQPVNAGARFTARVTAPWTGGEPLQIRTEEPFSITAPMRIDADGITYTSGSLVAEAADGSRLTLDAGNGDPASLTLSIDADGGTSAFTLSVGGELQIPCLVRSVGVDRSPLACSLIPELPL